MTKMLRVLMVEDSEDDALLVMRTLKKGGYDPVYQRVETAEAMRAALREKTWDVILCDYQMPKFNGLNAIAVLKESNFDIPLIIVSGAIGEEIAADCMRFGAHDYVMKDNLPRLVPAMERELREVGSRRQRKRAEEELKDRESELAAIYANAPLIMVVVDREWTIRKTNAFAARFVGRAVGDMIHLRCGESFQCMHSFDAPEGCGFGPSCAECTLRLTAIDTIKTGRSHHQVETIMSLSAGGKKREAVFLLSTARLTIKGEHRTLVSMEDITERKRGEEALRRSEENFRHSLDDLQMGVRIVTEKGETLYANRSMLDLYGYDNLEELRTTPIRKRYTPESHADFLTRREKRWQGADVSMEYPVSIIRKDGELRHLNVFRKEVLWGGETQYQVVYQDVTERRRSEEALLKSEGLLRGLFENMTSGAAIYDVIHDGSKGSDYIIKDFNINSLQIEGKRKEDVVGKSLFDLRPNIDQYGLIPIFQKVWRTGEPGYFPSKIYIDENYSCWYENRVFKLPTGEIVAIYDDVTERKQAEEELRTSRSQLRALALHLQQIREEERVQIAREVHDEMGGGLTGLKMDLSRLLRAVSDSAPPEWSTALLERIQTANASIDQMIQVVRRISTGLRPPVLDDLGLMAALEWQLSEFTNRTAIPHEFVTTFEDLALEKYKAVTIFRIFQEALTNVVRHSRATRVVVILREGERTLFGDEELVLEIRDNGRGITEEEILNPESLGLLGMKERVLAVGGKLSIQGEPGGGTTLVLNILRKQGGAL